MAAKKIVPTMEELFDTMPEMPANWKDECMKNVPEIPIYYRIKGNYADCTCGKCGLDYKIRFRAGSPDQEFIPMDKKPGRHEEAKCKLCGAEGLYEWKKCTNPFYMQFTVLMMQRCSDGNLVVRYIKCHNTYEQGIRQRFHADEIARIFLTMGDYYKFYWDKLYGWGRVWPVQLYEDLLYPGSLQELQESNLKYHVRTGASLMEDLKAYSKNPGIEMMCKAGLRSLAMLLVSKDGSDKHINRRGKSMRAQLRLKDKGRINFLIKHNGSTDMLELLQEEEKKGIRYTDEQRLFLLEIYRSWKGKEMINHLTRYMSLQKLINRIDKYIALKENDFDNRTTILSRWHDYLGMREELGYDMTNEVFIYPKSLKKKHDEMVKERNRRRDELFEAKAEQTYKGIAEKFEELMKKYGLEAEGLVIRPAMNATEIIQEGRTLHHCVGRDTYLARHSRGESFILFLRKVEEKEKPYYTIEIRNDHIVQWYGAHDKKPDKEVVGPWLNNFIAHIGGNQVVYA